MKWELFWKRDLDTLDGFCLTQFRNGWPVRRHGGSRHDAAQPLGILARIKNVNFQSTRAVVAILLLEDLNHFVCGRAQSQDDHLDALLLKFLLFLEKSRATLTHLDSQIGFSSLSIQAWHAQARIVSSLSRDRWCMWYVGTNNEKPSSTRYSSDSPRIHRLNVYCKLNFSYHICNPQKFICWPPLADSVLYNAHYNFSSPSHQNVQSPGSMRRPASLD